MSNNEEHLFSSLHKKCRQSGRPSSFLMQDANEVFAEMNLKEENCFVDLGCGAGDYSLRAAEIVAEKGNVYAFDYNTDSVNALKRDLEEKGISNIFPAPANITERIPLNDSVADVCLIATVLHALPRERLTDVAKEVYRIIAPGGQLVTIDCSKEDCTMGPPKHMRLDPKEITALMSDAGFTFEREKSLGFNFLLSFKKE